MRSIVKLTSRNNIELFLVSFDVESLFTNVPIDATVQAALQKLENVPNLALH